VPALFVSELPNFVHEFFFKFTRFRHDELLQSVEVGVFVRVQLLLMSLFVLIDVFERDVVQLFGDHRVVSFYLAFVVDALQFVRVAFLREVHVSFRS